MLSTLDESFSVGDEIQCISRHIQKIEQLSNDLEALNQNICLSGDSRVKSELLSSKEKNAAEVIESTMAKLARFASQPISEPSTKIQLEMLNSRFKTSLQRFQRIQAGIKRRISTVPPVMDPAVADLLGLETEFHQHGYDSKSTAFPPGTQQAQLSSNDRASSYELSHSLEQEQQMQALEEDITNVNAIFQQLSNLVFEQRTVVDSIEDNIQTAYINQESGVSRLEKAATSRQRSRRRCCICSLVLVVAIIITILVLILVYGPGSKK
ncbi:unnamed protein product [Dicrocoelium dendriticum]|nr:unnamed protein product [Dicrocoelium dendriticum]